MDLRQSTDRLMPGEMPVLDPVRTIGFGAQPFFAVRLVFRIISLEPHCPAVSFKGQDVRGNTI